LLSVKKKLIALERGTIEERWHVFESMIPMIQALHQEEDYRKSCYTTCTTNSVMNNDGNLAKM